MGLVEEVDNEVKLRESKRAKEAEALMMARSEEEENKSKGE